MDSQAGPRAPSGVSRGFLLRNGPGLGGQRGEQPAEVGGQIRRADHGVDQTVGVQVRGGLHAAGERRAVQGLIDAGAEETDERARLGQGQVTEGRPGGEHPSAGGMAQVDDVGQVSGLVRGDRHRDLRHLQERDRALLHAGAAGGGQRDQRQPLGGGPFDGPGQPFPGRHADRPAQETELARGDGHPPPGQHALAGDHRFVQAGPVPRRGQAGGVGGVRPHIGRGLVPRPERARGQQRAQQFTGLHPASSRPRPAAPGTVPPAPRHRVCGYTAPVIGGDTDECDS